MDKKLLAVAGGTEPADVVIKNGQIVNVYTGEIYEGGVAICDQTIAAVGDVEYCIGEGTKIIDAGGKYITPGFIDGHIHPESSDLAIRPFAEGVLKHGTTSIMTDLHEVGVVSGIEGIEAVLAENEITDLNLYFVVPSHVPFSPALETSAGQFNPEIIRKALQREDAVGISECVGPYILADYPDLMESLDDVAGMKGMTAQGHLVDMKGAALNKCVAAGVSTCHEALSPEEIMDRARVGCYAMLRESSAARTLAQQLTAIVGTDIDTSMMSIVTDDLHCCDLAETGHLDHHLKLALGCGLPFVKAIQMVTINAARAFELTNIGALAPGKRADINLVEGDTADTFAVKDVFSRGKQVVENGELLVHYPVAEHNPCLLNTTKLLNPITPDSFKITAPEGAKKVKVTCMDTLPWIPITQPREVELEVEDGYVKCDLEQDVLYIAQVERYGINGNVGKAFMGGFHLNSGAVASSVGHDNHNIIVMGTNFEDMAVAVNRLIEIGGGQILVDGGEIIKEIAYPVCGLLSDLSVEELAAEKAELNAACAARGCIIGIPMMFLSFICLAALPTLAITDHGFINVLTMQVEDPIKEVIE
ncbi:MAG: adenine deaminase C-terminal domain-containing protein [Eggerthellales bacterium]|nr:adenine deaminase C-terminal domain-containing protein [Eggerthellales bacterium]